MDDMVEWGENSKRMHRIRWYMGTAGIWKSALAQSVAEAFAKAECLGATFFSRRGKLDDPDAVIPTIAYQFATKNPIYMSHTTQLLERNPLILENDHSTQFRELLVERLSPLQLLVNLLIDRPFSLFWTDWTSAGTLSTRHFSKKNLSSR
jgi:hypothetical protein